MDMGNQWLVVVRSAGERTAKVCADIAAMQVGQTGKTIVIEERPFARSLERSIDIAIQSGCEYAVFLDGDVLLRKNAFQIFTREVKNWPMKWYKMNCCIMDYAFAGPTYGGAHIYRVAYLRNAWVHVQDSYRAQRPETFVAMRMAGSGYPTILRKDIVGVHDYEQYYKDMYRKCFVRACKFNRRIGFMLERCLTGIEGDPTRRVMLRGFLDGLAYWPSGQLAPLDVFWYEERSADVVRKLGLQEKGELTGLDEDFADAIIDSFVPDRLYEENRHWIAPDMTVQWYGRRRGIFKRIRAAAAKVREGIVSACEEMHGR